MRRLDSRSRRRAIARNGRWLRTTHSLSVTYPYEGRKQLLADRQGSLSLGLGVKKFHLYLFGRHFTQVKDHEPLTSILNPKKEIPAMTPPNMETRMDYHAYP